MSSAPEEAWRLATILNSVAEAVIATDRAGVITLLNPAAERLFAVHLSELQGQPVAALHAGLEPWLARAQAEAAPTPLVFSLEVAAGRPHSATLAPLQSEAGRPPGWVIVLQDNAGLKQAEEWRAEAVQAATHDLRSPLNLMNGALNLLNDLLRAPTPEQRECLDMLRAGLDRMAGLVEQALNLNQVTGNASLHLAGVDLCALTARVADEHRLAAVQQELRLSFNGPASAGRVVGDESWLDRALANLIGNALKYTPRGGQVRVTYREANGEAICEITDTGPGIPAAAQARLFERFYRAPGEATRRVNGTGLGLAIVKTVVERHSGRVWVSSQEGQGSTFGFALPLAPG